MYRVYTKVQGFSQVQTTTFDLDRGFLHFTNDKGQQLWFPLSEVDYIEQYGAKEDDEEISFAFAG